MESKEFFSLVFIGLTFALVFFLILGTDGITGFLVKEETSKIILNIEDEEGKPIDFALISIKNDIETISKTCYSNQLCDFTLNSNYPYTLTITKEGYFEYIKDLKTDSLIKQLDVVLIKSGYSDITLTVIDTSYNALQSVEVYAKTSEGVFKLVTNSEGRAYLKAPIGSRVQYSTKHLGYTSNKGYFEITKPIETNRLILSPSK
jgi:hypothetical protein